MAEFVGDAIGIGEQVAALAILGRDMKVHRAARLAFHRLGHERGIDAVFQRDLAYDALENRDLVAQRDRFAMIEIDFKLRGAAFVDHRIELQRGDFRIVVDFLDDVFEFGHRFKAIGLRRTFRAARPALWRDDRQVGIGVDLGQIEFELRPDDHGPADFGKLVEHALQHIARRDFERRAIAVQRIGHDERGRGAKPRCDADRADIGAQRHVGVAIEKVVGIGIGIVAGDRH